MPRRNRIIDKRKVLGQTMAELIKEDVCLAFLGGVDSGLLLRVAVDAAAKTDRNVYVVTFDNRLRLSRDSETVIRVAEELGGIHEVISVDELEQEEIRDNPINRCCLCKRHLFQSLKDFAGTKRVRTVIDGTSEDDMRVYRPGIKALKELGVISPLVELHIAKAEMKSLVVEYGISVASRPSAPCMATRLPCSTEINYETLERIAQKEAYLRETFSGNIRLHLRGDIVRIEMDVPAMPEVLEKRQQAITYLKNLGFLYITLDLEGFRPGSIDVHVSDQDR